MYSNYASRIYIRDIRASFKSIECWFAFSICRVVISLRSIKTSEKPKPIKNKKV
ncbi:hypothetical protein JCM19300_3584 [Algibacter lectus]|uniref:Uncharacterized protein n=1 Tax=Algibacter lectus TaxID=221126 RepID=A0A090V743_9FLAO|nr:hypothetical protein JCM19300_3584 [Algibacter lectus]